MHASGVGVGGRCGGWDLLDPPLQHNGDTGVHISLAGAATSIIFVATNTCMLAATKRLSRFLS